MGISTDDLAYFVDRAVDGMVEIVRDLGDELACTRPDLPGANSPYAILTHCLGVMSYWGGQTVAGRDVDRDRDAEFRVTGSVDSLVQACAAAKRQFAADLAAAKPDQPLRRPPEGSRQLRPVMVIGRAAAGLSLSLCHALIPDSRELLSRYDPVCSVRIRYMFSRAWEPHDLDHN
jgi:hypothetical protein